MAGMQLGDLVRLAALPEVGLGTAASRVVTGIRYDSRCVQPGDLFVAVPGASVDGLAFVPDALARGAAAIVSDRPADVAQNVPLLLVPSVRVALADLAAAFHGFPARALHVTGITGTDGKTTSTFLLSHILEGMGRATGLLSTVAFKIGDQWQDNLARQSTLESPEIQEALAAMVRRGIQDAVLEATSHGLVLQRVRRCAFDSVLVTNVTSEHLDFHGTRAHYLAAKALLLDAVLEAEGKQRTPVAAINMDDEGSASLLGRARGRVVTFGTGVAVEVKASAIASDAQGSTFVVEAGGERHAVQTRLPGHFNVQNCLGVLALLHGRDFPLHLAVPHIATFPGVPGRMRRVDRGQPFTVVVDYAHTAASLEKVLLTLRPLTRGRLIVVFGSAGERDREKRPAMGAVAARIADYTVITDEDPRKEPSAQILQAIADGAQAAGAQQGKDYLCIVDRARAIAHAIGMAAAGDVVLLAGKGHEKSMILADGSVPWDEEDVACRALRAAGFGALV
jgi:UDP-N-acetylmuramoyl-L-alanyl-D-glutamate--2,6-diaminopimelate ligase